MMCFLQQRQEDIESIILRAQETATHKNATQDSFQHVKKHSVPRAAYINHANKIDLNAASTRSDDKPKPTNSLR
jgi:hypothetical protein